MGRKLASIAPMKIQNFKDLIVWQKAMDLAEEIHLLSKAFPRDELYGLTSQIRRAAVSVPSNIAEGQARNSTAQFLQFLSISHGSRAEVETQLLLALRFQYLNQAQASQALDLLEDVKRLLHGLENSLR